MTGHDQEVVQLLRHEPLDTSEKHFFIHDMADVLLGKTTRTVMSDDPRGGSPVPMDLWAFRDAGFVDRDLLDYLRRRFGSEQTANIRVDELGFDQYENACEYYADLARELNKITWQGLKWRPHQVQAVGRVSAQLSMEVKPLFPCEFFARAGLNIETAACVQS